MSTSVVARLSSFVERVHTRLFGYAPTPAMRGFLKNLSWSMVGVVGSAAVLFVVSLLGARLLGPTEYGKYSLTISIANIVAVLCALGFDQAAVKFMSERAVTDVTQGTRYYSNSLRITATTSLLVALLIILLRPFIASFSGVEASILLMAAVYALFLAIRQGSEVFMRASQLFKPQAIIKIIEAVSTLLFFGALYVSVKNFGFTWYVGVLIAAGVVAMAIIYTKYLRQNLQPWDRKAFQEVRRYAQNSLFVSLVGILVLNVDRFFLNQSLGAGEVGIYSAYMLIPSTLATYFATAVVNVFFPTVNTLPDKRVLMRKLDKVAAYSVVPGIAGYFALGYVVFSLLGRAYRLDPGYLLLASIYGYVLVYVAMAAAIVGSSERMYRSYARLLLVKLVAVSIIYTVLLKLHLISIAALMTVLIVSVLIDCILFRVAAARQEG